MELDPRICERARLARDARFDGLFFVAVTSTRIYCRPICPVQPPASQNVRFFGDAAAAARAGFRPCLRCRPECAPGSPAWRGTTTTVHRALARIEAGALDAGSLDALADELGVGARHLRRLFTEHLGTTPAAVAETRRLHRAKRLLDGTDLPVTEVAFAAGFSSVRRFHDVIRRTYGRTPTALRAARAGRRGERAAGAGELTLELSFRPPHDWPAMRAFLAARAIAGLESVTARGYARTFELDGRAGTVEIDHEPGTAVFDVRFTGIDARHLLEATRRVRALLDLACDPAALLAQLGPDPWIGPLVRARPGLRVPGGWDPFELAVRAVLGQQVSVAAARTLVARLVERFGGTLEPRRAGGPDRTFPSAATLAEAPLHELGLPAARARALRALASAVASGALALEPGCDPDDVGHRLARLPGIGPWTAAYVGLRGLGHPDSFPATDLVLQRAARARGVRLDETAARWQPWRGYAALHLWTAAADAGGPRSERRCA